MKKFADLVHNGFSFWLVDKDGTHIAKIDPGKIDGDIDWDFVDEQASEYGYTIYEGDK
jgi:hypothetical protein